MTVRGVRDVLTVFDHLEAGKFQSVDFIEAYICPDGCVSGPLLVEGRYTAKRTAQQIAGRLGRQSAVKEEKVRSLFQEHFFDLEDEVKARVIKPLAPDLRQAVRLKQEKAEILARLPRKDCAACGAPDCRTLAQDILAGDAVIEDCVFVRLESLPSHPAASGTDSPGGPGAGIEHPETTMRPRGRKRRT